MPAMRIRFNAFGALDELEGGGVVMPQIEVEVDDPEVAYRLHLTVQVLHGKPICTDLAAERKPGGVPVTRRGLNSLPLGAIVREAASRGAMSVTQGDGWRSYDLIGPDDAARLEKKLACSGGRRREPGRRDELVRQAATAYRELTRAQVLQPKPLIAAEMNISASYVSQLLAEARRRGILGPAIPGRAGESAEGSEGDNAVAES